MKTSRLRSNFARKHLARTKKRRTLKKRKTHKRRIMRGGNSINFKKYNGYGVYDEPINEISYSGIMPTD
jgi:hypothetical protein